MHGEYGQNEYGNIGPQTFAYEGYLTASTVTCTHTHRRHATAPWQRRRASTAHYVAISGCWHAKPKAAAARGKAPTLPSGHGPCHRSSSSTFSYATILDWYMYATMLPCLHSHIQ